MTKILLPKGEWLSDVLQFFSRLDLELVPMGERALAYTLAKSALPLFFVAVRARDVGKIVSDPDSDACLGFTGSDIVAEQSLARFGTLGTSANLRTARVVFGATPNWSEKVAKLRVEELPVRSTIVTAYPNLANKFVSSRTVADIEVVERLGAIEGYWWIDPSNTAIIDVTVTGDTLRANRITPIETLIDEVTIDIVRTQGSDLPGPKIDRFIRDFNVMDDFMTLLMKRQRAQQKRR